MNVGIVGALILAMFFLVGCSAQNIREGHSISAEEKKGIIVGSLTQDSGRGTKGVYTIFYLHKKDGPRFAHIKSRHESLIGYQAGDFEDVEGRLFSIEAPTGKYQITSWQIYNGTGARIYPREYPDPIEFDVESGKVTYIGNLHMRLRTGKNVLGITITGDGYPVIKDEFDRDYLIFQSNYPGVRDLPLSKQIAHSGPWVKGFDESMELDPTPVMSPGE